MQGYDCCIRTNVRKKKKKKKKKNEERWNKRIKREILVVVGI